MASIQKLVNKKGISYRVQIRRKGLPNISRTFLSKKQASLFALKLEDNATTKPISKLQKKTLPLKH